MDRSLSLRNAVVLILFAVLVSWFVSFARNQEVTIKAEQDDVDLPKSCSDIIDSALRCGDFGWQERAAGRNRCKWEITNGGDGAANNTSGSCEKSITTSVSEVIQGSMIGEDCTQFKNKNDCSASTPINPKNDTFCKFDVETYRCMANNSILQLLPEKSFQGASFGLYCGGKIAKYGSQASFGELKYACESMERACIWRGESTSFNSCKAKDVNDEAAVRLCSGMTFTDPEGSFDYQDLKKACNTTFGSTCEYVNNGKCVEFLDNCSSQNERECLASPKCGWYYDKEVFSNSRCFERDQKCSDIVIRFDDNFTKHSCADNFNCYLDGLVCKDASNKCKDARVKADCLSKNKSCIFDQVKNDKI